VLGDLSDREIDDVLRGQNLGRVGCHGAGRTYVVPINYAFDGSHIYGLSCEGMKMRLMRQNPRVCFEVEQIEDWMNWRTVIAWGNFEELDGEEAERGHRLLQSRLTPLMEFETKRSHRGDYLWPPGIAEPPLIIYRIVLEERTGRFERLS
jgi:nitroimidazol reductase NimA-like FMN-containing flavoprotein (pyridoxamine 5'-phosphate oxidase superfamily)